MAGTIYSNTYVNGIVLSNPATELPATVTGSVSNTNGNAILGRALARWTVSNEGTIANTGSARYGVYLAAGGVVENGGSGASGALIKGSGGVLIRGETGTVNNLATITGTGGEGDGVELQAGGRVTNGSAGATAAQLSGRRHAVAIHAALGEVSNFGTLTSSTTYAAVFLFGGGGVINGGNTSPNALIQGGGSGVTIEAAPATVTNLGTITGNKSGTYLADGGNITNGDSTATRALITTHGGSSAVIIAGGAGSVTNLGTIASAGSHANGVRLKAGGSVTNGGSTVTAALISGGDHGVYIAGGAGTVTNLGTIASVGSHANGVRLKAGGRVTNGSSAATAASIYGNGSGIGVYVTGGAGTLINFATIADGWGVLLHNGGRVANETSGDIAGNYADGLIIEGNAGTVTNLGTVVGARIGVYLAAGGSVVNGGKAADTALISGGYYGIYTAPPFFIPQPGKPGGPAAITNLGTIAATGGNQSAISLRRGGGVVNGDSGETTALIKGEVYVSTGSVTNFGTIKSTRIDAILLEGDVTNGSASSTAAYIAGTVDFIMAPGTVTNFGTIVGYSDFASISAGRGKIENFGLLKEGISILGGEVINKGTIESGKYAIESGSRYQYFDTTVTNFGTIVGKVALFGTSKVVVEPGSSIGDAVTADGGPSTIDFETAGAAGMSNVSGFKTITLGNGKGHTLTLTSANFAAVVGAAITVEDGNSGNTVSAASLLGSERIIVHAGGGLDKLTGGKGGDAFFAGNNTVMTGNAGRNQFIFSAAGDNRVADFAVSAGNEVVFSNKGFSLGSGGASGTPKALPAGLFVENSDGHFTDTTQRFAYATGSGDLFYSASGENGTPALVSHFTGAPSLAASQLFFIT